MNEINNSEGGILLPLIAGYQLLKKVPVRKAFSKGDSVFISTYGHCIINRITIVREPIKSYVGSALNLITLGKWQKAVAKYGYDKIFHLFALIDVIDTLTGKTVSCVYEKNETPRCYKFTSSIASDAEIKYVEKQTHFSLNEFIMNSKAQMGDQFWTYDAFKNNCQNFILNSLDANQILTGDMIEFVHQNVDAIVRELPSYTGSIANAITDTARRVRTIFGRGLNDNMRRTF